MLCETTRNTSKSRFFKVVRTPYPGSPYFVPRVPVLCTPGPRTLYPGPPYFVPRAPVLRIRRAESARLDDAASWRERGLWETHGPARQWGTLRRTLGGPKREPMEGTGRPWRVRPRTFPPPRARRSVDLPRVGVDHHVWLRHRGEAQVPERHARAVEELVRPVRPQGNAT